MSNISGKETKPEIMVRKYLFANGFRYRKNVKTMPGKPDIVLPRYKTVIFIHGCFWHGHKNCKKAILPKTNSTFWKNKINCNIDRDKTNINDLGTLGWHVLIIWQCQLRNIKVRAKTLKQLLLNIKKVRYD